MVKASGSKNRENDDEAWRKWNLDEDPLLFFKGEDKDKAVRPALSVPNRQRQAGQENGLSIVVRMDKQKQVCPLTDGNALMV